MAGVNLITSIIALNVNGLNAPVKKQRLSDWIRRRKKIQLHAAGKRHILDSKTRIG